MDPNSPSPPPPDPLHLKGSPPSQPQAKLPPVEIPAGALMLKVQAPVTGEWIGPKDVRPIKGYDQWYERLFGRSDVKEQEREGDAAALEGTFVRLSSNTPVQLSPAEAIYVEAKLWGASRESRVLALRVTRALSIKPEQLGKVVLLLHYSAGQIHPVMLPEGATEVEPIQAQLLRMPALG